MPRMFTRTSIASLATWLLAVVPVLAKGSAQVSPAPAQNHWWPAILGIFLVGCVLVGSFMSARRSHQD